MLINETEHFSEENDIFLSNQDDIFKTSCCITVFCCALAFTFIAVAVVI